MAANNGNERSLFLPSPEDDAYSVAQETEPRAVPDPVLAEQDMSQQEQGTSERPAVQAGSTQPTDQRFAPGGLFLKPLSLLRQDEKKQAACSSKEVNDAFSTTS